jgi:hypothetical protein
MLDDCPQPCIEGAAPRSSNTPVDSCYNAQAHDFVPGRENLFSAIAGLVDIDGIIRWRPLSGHRARAVIANGGPSGKVINDFNRLCRAGRSVPRRTGRRQAATASAARTGPRLKACRRAGPRKTNTQR